MSVKNAREFPKVWFGLHFQPGIAEYRPENEEPYRIFINEKTIRKMSPSFAGKPVYVKHVDEVDLDNIQHEADGYVVESFYNKADGKHWTKFLAVSDLAHNAIRNGWKLSNAYVPKSFAPGGVHNGVDYDKEVMDAEYEHLALVDDPRYEESMILSPEEFKEYNLNCELELQKLANSKDKKGESKMGLKFWKKSKVENSSDLENTVVLLPKSKKQMSISALVNAHDKVLNMHGYANGDHHVKVGEEEMSVNDLVNKYNAMMEEKAKNESDAEENESDESEQNESEEAEENDADDGDGEKNSDDSEENDSDEKKEPELSNKKKNAGADEKKEPELSNKKKNKQKNSSDREDKGHYDRINNARDTGEPDDEVIDLVHNQLTRGKDRYGSG